MCLLHQLTKLTLFIVYYNKVRAFQSLNEVISVYKGTSLLGLKFHYEISALGCNSSVLSKHLAFQFKDVQLTMKGDEWNDLKCSETEPSCMYM